MEVVEIPRDVVSASNLDGFSVGAERPFGG